MRTTIIAAVYLDVLFFLGTIRRLACRRSFAPTARRRCLPGCHGTPPRGTIGLEPGRNILVDLAASACGSFKGRFVSREVYPTKMLAYFADGSSPRAGTTQAATYHQCLSNIYLD